MTHLAMLHVKYYHGSFSSLNFIFLFHKSNHEEKGERENRHEDRYKGKDRERRGRVENRERENE